MKDRLGTMVRSSVLVMGLVALSLGGCAAITDESSVSAGEMAALAGRWQGTIWEIGSVFYQGRTALDIRLADDGTWSGTVGRAQASGRARMQRGWLVLSGTATIADGHQQAVYYQLTGDTTRRWGTIASTFSGGDGQGRVEHATVALYKTS